MPSILSEAKVKILEEFMCMPLRRSTVGLSKDGSHAAIEWDENRNRVLSLETGEVHTIVIEGWRHLQTIGRAPKLVTGT